MANNGRIPSPLISVDDKPRREVIHLWPLPESPFQQTDLEEVIDANSHPVKGNELYGETLYKVAGLPNRIPDDKCHGAQLELWMFRGAQIRRDICPRLADAPEPDSNEAELRKQKTNVQTKLTRRRQLYRLSIKGGLVHGYQTNSRLFAEISSGLSNDQLILASPWPINLQKKVMINPKTGNEEPLFKPQEVPAQIRDGLNAARALGKAEKLRMGWEAIPNPPTLAAWLKANPTFKDYDPQDLFYDNVFYANEDDEARSRVSTLIMGKPGNTGKPGNSNTARITPGGFAQTSQFYAPASSSFLTPAISSSYTPAISSSYTPAMSHSFTLAKSSSYAPKDDIRSQFLQPVTPVPTIKTKEGLLQAVLDRLVLDKELYRKAYTDFIENKTTRKVFEETVAMPMLIARNGTMEVHEKLMELHSGGPVWQHLDINTWGRQPGISYEPLNIRNTNAMQAHVDEWNRNHPKEDEEE